MCHRHPDRPAVALKLLVDADEVSAVLGTKQDRPRLYPHAGCRECVDLFVECWDPTLDDWQTDPKARRYAGSAAGVLWLIP